MNDRESRTSSLADRIRSGLLVGWSSAVGPGLAVLVAWFLDTSGWIADQQNTLQVMGFDPDRAVLISALVLGAIGSAIVAIVGGRFRVAVLTGAGLIAVGFWGTFRHETGAAIRARPPDGVFDPLGWTLTVVTLIVTALIVGWAAAVLGRDVRASLRTVGRALRSFPRAAAAGPRRLRPVGATVVAILLLVVTLPILGDMMNFDPDSHMLQGAPAAVGLFGGGAGNSGEVALPSVPGASLEPGATAGSSPSPSSSSRPRKGEALVPPADLVPGPVPGSLVTAGALSAGRPWAGQPPTGGGRTFSVNLPGPWRGGLTDHATIDIYLPPGYDGGTRRYPVIYEPHQPLWAWERGMQFTSILDSLIRAGTIPPEIVVFVDQYGGPYADSECANSWDGTEWFDTYLGQTVPAWADANLRTIPTAAARSLLGFSSGGYCAAAALTHHPDVFGSALIFSSYFVAGIRTTTTPIAYRPFNGDPVIEQQQSPINIVPKIAAATRATMFVTLSADPANRFYGSQATDFAAVLDANRVPLAILPTPLGHSWAAVREQIPAVLSMLAARQVALGVFGAAG